MTWMKKLQFKDGIMPAITQDYKTGEVLMLAYMNREALKKTIKTKKCHYYSRSRKKLWLKGESSGHTQTVKEIFVDCDMDCLLIKIEQKGGACHKGYRSCFYRKVAPRSTPLTSFGTLRDPLAKVFTQPKGRLKITGKKVFDPKKVY
jgi:phosphoribosyl-AMP cyclohydrolase